MSTSTNITQQSTSGQFPIQLPQLGAVAIGLVVAITVFLFAVDRPDSPASPAQPVTDGQMSHERFLDLNTAALVGPAATVATDPTASVDPFQYWNITALDLAGEAGAETEATADGFLYWNTTALEYSGSTHPEPTRGPR